MKTDTVAALLVLGKRLLAFGAGVALRMQGVPHFLQQRLWKENERTHVLDTKGGWGIAWPYVRSLQ